jgi:tetratricopeptide (TPR) repeat protein
MLEDQILFMHESDDPGMRLLLEGRSEEAEEYFSGLAQQDSYLGYYGLATARFKRDSLDPDRKRTEEIIQLYKKSITLKSDFADPYFMCGLAYEQMASLLTQEYKKDPLKGGDKKVEKIKEALMLAKEMIEKAVELNPSFRRDAQSELSSYEVRLEGLDRLKRHFTNTRN